MTQRRRRVVLCLTIAAAGACTPPPSKPVPPPPPAEKCLQHRIKYEGETLGKIAQWYTGAENNWKKIAAKNPKIDAQRLKLGQEICIPVKLVKRKDPLPKPRGRIDSAIEQRAVQKPAEQLEGFDAVEEVPAAQPEGENPEDFEAAPLPDTDIDVPPHPKAQQAEEVHLKTREELLREILEDSLK